MEGDNGRKSTINRLQTATPKHPVPDSVDGASNLCTGDNAMVREYPFPGSAREHDSPARSISERIASPPVGFKICAEPRCLYSENLLVVA